MNSSAGDGYSNNDRSVRHVLIKQVNKLAAAEEFTLDGQPLKMILVVGLVTECKVINSRAIVEFSDGTGSLTATLWNIKEEKGYELELNQYACGYLEVRNYNDTVKFVASNIIQPVPFSQVLYHEMCAVQEHLRNSGQLPGPSAPKAEQKFGDDMFGDNERLKEQVLGVLNEEDGRSLEFLSREFEMEAGKIKELLVELDNSGRTWNDGEAWYLTTD